MKSFDCAILQQLQIEDPFTGRKLSINVLVEVVEPVLMEKRDVKSNGFVEIIKKLLAFLDYQDPDAKVKIIHFFLNSPPQVARCCLSPRLKS